MLTGFKGLLSFHFITETDISSMLLFTSDWFTCQNINAFFLIGSFDLAGKDLFLKEVIYIYETF